MAQAHLQKLERRHAYRYSVQMPVVWENLVEQHPGTVSDISASGCFVLCNGPVSKGESIRIRVTNLKGKSMPLWSEVVNYVREVGFAANFVEVNQEESLFLQEFMTQLSKAP
jgi:hypothetical protein